MYEWKEGRKEGYRGVRRIIDKKE